MAKIDDLFATAQTAANALATHIGELYAKAKQDGVDATYPVTKAAQQAIAAGVAEVKDTIGDTLEAFRAEKQKLKDEYELLQKNFEAGVKVDVSRGAAIIQEIRDLNAKIFQAVKDAAKAV